MRTVTVGNVLDDLVVHRSGECVYLVRDGATVLYVGQSKRSVVGRLLSHLGRDERYPTRSELGYLIEWNLPNSKDWLIEIYTLEELEQQAVAYVQGTISPGYTQYHYYKNGQWSIDFAERALIALHTPPLNLAYNPNPTDVPERYRRPLSCAMST